MNVWSCHATIDGRLNDADIQTLLLPTDLERKLNAITSKCRTWAQETGMNVLHVAYGFLEWSDGAHAETSLAPLILREAAIEKHQPSSPARIELRRLDLPRPVDRIIASDCDDASRTLALAIHMPSLGEHGA